MSSLVSWCRSLCCLALALDYSRSFSYITAYSPSLTVSSLLSIISASASLAVSHLFKRNWSPPYLKPVCSQWWISVTRSFTSHSSTNLPAMHFADYASVMCFFHPIMVLYIQDPWLQVCSLCDIPYCSMHAGSFQNFIKQTIESIDWLYVSDIW